MELMSNLIATGLLVIFCCFCWPAASKVVVWNYNTKDNFIFAGKFCFLNGGNLTIEVEGGVEPYSDAQSSDILFNVYNDQNGNSSWSKVEKLSGCQAKVNASLTPGGKPIVISNNTREILSFHESPPMYWWFAVSDCNLSSSQRLQFKLRLEFLNPGNGWYKQFSYDEQNILTLYLTFVLLWILILPCYLGILYTRRKHINVSMVAFFAAIAAYILALFIFLIYYSAYASNGYGVPGFLVIGSAVQMFSSLLFIFSVLWYARKLEQFVLAEIKIFLLTIIFLYLMYVIFFIWNSLDLALDLQSLHYEWDTLPGIFMLIIRCLLWLFFIGLIVLRIRDGRNAAYRAHTAIFAAAGSVWFLYLPLAVTIAVAIPVYDREKTILGITLSIDFLIYAVFALLSIPNEFTRTLKFAQPKVPVDDENSESTPFGL